MAKQRIPDDWEEKVKMSVAELGMSVRTTNCLEEHGIDTVLELLNRTRDQLKSISNFGGASLAEVYSALANLGFYRG